MLVEIPFFISEAKMAMYPILANSAKREMPWGKANLDDPLFTGASAEKLTLVARFEQQSQRLTGAKHARPRQRGALDHEIRLNQVWVTRPDADDDAVADDFVLVRDALYFMTFAWQEPGPKAIEDSAWKARIYYGVTTPSFGLDGSPDTVAFSSEKVFTAMFMKEKHGIGPIVGLL
jgi:hypothetical protein